MKLRGGRYVEQIEQMSDADFVVFLRELAGGAWIDGDDGHATTFERCAVTIERLSVKATALEDNVMLRLKAMQAERGEE